MKKITVLVVDDSALFRSIISSAINRDNELTVVGTAANGIEAFERINALRPDVITLDNEMPKLSGIDFLKKAVPELKVKAIVVTSSPISAFDAISAGAVDYISKPSREQLLGFNEEIVAKIKAAAGAELNAAVAVSKQAARTPVILPKYHAAKSEEGVIALGASTGGTDSLLVLLQSFPADCPGTLIVQHMPPVFTRMYAERLNRLCQPEVREAKDGDRLTPGLVLVGAGEYHLRLCRDERGYYVSSKKGDRVSGHCPSVDVLFESVAKVAGKNASGAILTGMGADGAEGLLKMRQAGAYTVGQDKETCVVYGMPAVAFNKGAVVTQAPLEKIAALLLQSRE